MNQEDFNNAYILLFSGAAELKGAEIKWKDEWDRDIYIEFPDSTPTNAIIRGYYNNGNKYYEYKLVKGIRHGKESCWYNNGKLSQECNWANGVKHGKESCWHMYNEILWWECEWVNGVKHGKESCWREDKKLDWEHNWVNGKLI